MSAPDTNLNRETKRHKPSLLGLALAGSLVVLLVAAIALWPKPLVEDGADSGATVQQ